MKLKELFENYLKHLKFYRRKGTFQAYSKDFKLLLKAMDDLGIKELDDLSVDTYDHIIRWIKMNTKKKNSKTNDTMSSFMTALTYNKIDYNFRIIKLTDDTTPFRIINDDELAVVLNYLWDLDLDETNNLLWVTSVLLAFDTGARKNELINIRCEDVDFVRRYIYLETTKNDKRIVKFGDLSFKYVKKIYNKNNEYLLHNRLQKKRVTRGSIEHFFWKMNRDLKLAGGNVTLHRIRKTFATKLYLNGMPLPSIQKVLGHSDIRMTMKYIDVSMITLNKHYNKYYPY